MAKEHRYQFTVQGNGDFPIDMLRYDCCWPRAEVNSASIHGSMVTRNYQLTREIKLTGLRKPTEERWHSFGWIVTEQQRITLV